VVGVEAVVRDAVVLDGARVGAHARVERSIIGTDASVGDGASVLDCSIVGPEANVDSGTSITAARVEAANAVR
jgi:NDP-sugar pyrophosphorylase family protein